MIENQNDTISNGKIAEEAAPSIREHGNILPLLPLKNVVILPKSIIPIIVGRASSIQAVESALKKDKMLFITTQKDIAVEAPTASDLFSYGTRSTILQVMRMPNGAIKILAEGLCRARMIHATEQSEGFLAAEYEDLPTTGMEQTVELEAVWRQLKDLYTSYSELNEKAPADLAITARNADDMDYIADTIAVHINLSFDERQIILEIANLKERMLKLCYFLKKEIDILQTEQRIKGRIQTQVEKTQREYYLTEQMKAIQKELGREDQAAEITQIRAKIKTLSLPAEAQEKVEKELRKLEQMPPLSLKQW